MLHTLSGGWLGQPAPVKTDPIIVNGVRNGLAEAFARSITTHPHFWQTPDLKSLLWMKSVLVRSKVSLDHPIVKKIEETIEKCKKATQGLFQTPSNPSDHVHTARMREMITVSKVAAELPTEAPKEFISKFSQHNLRIPQVKEYIEKHGAELEEIELNFANDDLIQLISEKCPRLTSFKLGMRLASEMDKFTDKSLEIIGKMPLKKLDLAVWETITLTSEGFQKLLSQPQLQANLTELSLFSWVVTDQVIAPIAQYKQLNRLSITAGFVTPAQVESLFQSSALKTSLQSLELNMSEWQGVLVTDNLLKTLSQYGQLNELTFRGKWSVDSANVVNLLQARQNLIKLVLSGITITPEMAAKLSQMSQIQELDLEDCSGIGPKDFEALFNDKDNLNSLSLSKAEGCNDEGFVALIKLPNLLKLALSDCWGLNKGLEHLCQAENMQKNLTYLCLSDTKNACVTSRAFGQIGNLLALKALRIVNCSKFNATSMNEMLKTRLKNTLRELELTGTSITDAQIPWFSRFPQLTSLTLSNCDAVTQDGIVALLHSETLQEQLTKLYLDNVVITNEMVRDFEPFKHIETLIIGNPNELGYNQEREFFDLPNVKRNNAQVEVFVGEPV